MSENRFGCGQTSPVGRETCCIETGRIYDSCRDRDCFENVRVRLTECGNEIIGRTGNIRVKDAYIAWTYIGIDPVRFNRGFYSVNIRFYIKITFEGCIGSGKPQEFEGIVTVDKKVVLYGGESSVSVFKSDPADFGSCPHPSPCECEHRVPTVVLEAVDPIVLSVDVLQRNSSQTSVCCGDIPSELLSAFSDPLCDSECECGRILTVSLGIFSVVRMIRPAQLLINATEYTVPDKECMNPPEENPCGIFRRMSFPVKEFNPPSSCGSITERNTCNS